MELTITTLFCPDIKGAASDVLTRTLLFLQQAEEFKKVLIKHGCLTFNIPVQHQSRSIITTIEPQEYSGIYRFLLSTQGTSCSKPRGSP
jgi:hypothetical protein